MYSPVMFALFSLASFVTLGNTLSIAKTDVVSKAIQVEGVELIGQFGNKAFYQTVDPYPETNWYGAQSICNQTGLTIAKFQNMTEFDFVYNLLPGTSPWLWIGGTLKGFKAGQTRLAFEWDDNSELSSDLFFHHFSEHWVCLVFSRDQHIYTDFCLDGRHRAICQAIVE